MNKISVNDEINIVDCELNSNDLFDSVVIEYVSNGDMFCARYSDPYCGDYAKNILDQFNTGDWQSKRLEAVEAKKADINSTD